MGADGDFAVIGWSANCPMLSQSFSCTAGCFGNCVAIYVRAASDMELDLLAETESDSESNHSNQDNASGRRSVVTAATAGSEAGTK